MRKLKLECNIVTLKKHIFRHSGSEICISQVHLFFTFLKTLQSLKNELAMC